MFADCVDDGWNCVGVGVDYGCEMSGGEMKVMRFDEMDDSVARWSWCARATKRKARYGLRVMHAHGMVLDVARHWWGRRGRRKGR